MSGRETCRCPSPLPLERAARKGAATTECARCGLPVAPTLRRPPARAPAAAPDALPEDTAVLS